jgi:hypothetical protein
MTPITPATSAKIMNRLASPALCSAASQHFLNFLPLPHGQRSLRPTFPVRTG